MTEVGVRRLARCLIFLVALMNVLPMMSQARAFGVSVAGSPSVTSRLNIVGPAGSGAFGTFVAALSNGNIVVTDPFYSISSPTPIANVGAVYLYNGATGALISTLTGSTADDQVGVGGVTVLANGNYVVGSPFWNSGGIGSVGAATWGSATTGISGTVSAANSLVGSILSDEISANGIVPLANGNYVVRTPFWHNGAAENAGAVTWGNGATGTVGVVSAANSLVGNSPNDSVGNDSHSGKGVYALTNGNYVVCSPSWNNGMVEDAGAATWGNGATGTGGLISQANSLVGSLPFDQVGFNGVTALTNGNYVVSSHLWRNGAVGFAGAATWGNGTTGITGPISAANSLVGSTFGDQVSAFGVTPLANGNYVVCSPYWNNGAIISAGAATWCNGATGASGLVTAANSLVGTTALDQVCVRVTPLANGNYVVSSQGWDNGAIQDAGAATWGNGTTGISGPVSPANSLVGSTTFDNVSNADVRALANGNYVVDSSLWNNGAILNVGAVTWGNGATGLSGPVTAANSLVGSAANDYVGDRGVTALSNGNYVVCSPLWSNGMVQYVGAATWGNGATGIAGPVSAANSLIGGSAFSGIGGRGVTALSNGNYVVSSPSWNDGARFDAGAVTWANGAAGTVGVVSAANSLVGSTTDDEVGNVVAVGNGNYVVSSRLWDNGAVEDAGAVTFGRRNGSTVGPITAGNSVLGTVALAGYSLVFTYDGANRQLAVGQPRINTVTLLRVAEFDACLQDDANPNTSVVFDTQTGDYVFCAGGAQYSGTGTVTRRGSAITLQHNASDRRVQINLDMATNRATASLQKLGLGIFSLTDRDTRNDSCSCAAQ